LLTIKERIKQNKFYSCSHCGSNKHTKKNCDKLHLVFNLPKKPRKQKKRDNGEIYFLTVHIEKIYKLLMTNISLMTGSQTEGHGTKTKKSKKATEPNDEHQPLCQPSVSSSVNPNQDGN
jgi:hypothetical protein